MACNPPGGGGVALHRKGLERMQGVEWKEWIEHQWVRAEWRRSGKGLPAEPSSSRRGPLCVPQGFNAGVLSPSAPASYAAVAPHLSSDAEAPLS
jgi:hypothetical protein